jgi:hypothetical protein
MREPGIDEDRVNKVHDDLCSEIENLKFDLLEAQGCIEDLDRKNNALTQAENDWWQKRWQNNDMGKQLFEIRKKWKTAYQCAEKYQKMYEEFSLQGLCVECKSELLINKHGIHLVKRA